MGVKQKIVFLVSISLLFSMINIAGFSFAAAADVNPKNLELNKNQVLSNSNDENSYFTYSPNFAQVSGNFLEWVIEVEYNGVLFQKQVPVDTTDFKDRFLKHPEYGEKIYFDIDSDPEDDLEVTAGFYWATIMNPDGNEVKSLETRVQARQLQNGSYIEDSNGELEVRSTIHVNFGLIKKAGSSGQSNSQSLIVNLLNNLISHISNILPNSPLINILQNLINNIVGSSDEPVEPTAADNDCISVGNGYRSPQGAKIPLYTDKRFAFARQNIFSPTMFQQITNPDSSNQDPIEMIYGFRAFLEGQANPSYDIDFSIGFDPAVYLKTKFIPLGGYVYYHYDTGSQKNDEVAISYSSNLLDGLGEDIDLTLVFDKIDDNLAKSDSWMSFDLDLIGDNEPLGGNFHYKASDKFDVDLLVNSPSFNQKIKVDSLPTSADLSWDIDGSISLENKRVDLDVSGGIDLDMSSSIEKITVFYPKTYAGDEELVLLNIPEGIPRSTYVNAEIQTNVDLDNIMSDSNYVYGKLGHSCSRNIDEIEVFLPSVETPLVEMTDIPSYASAEGKLYWNRLSGFARATRSSTGHNVDPVHVHLEFDHPDYGSFVLDDTLEIRDGTIDTSFDLDNNGYLALDTTSKMFGNTLYVENTETGDSIDLDIEEVSAEGFRADWNLDTSTSQLKVNNLGFKGLIDTLKNLHLDLNYQGKSGSLDLNWQLGQSGNFEIGVAQGNALTLDFSQFAQDNEVFDLDGHITLSDYLTFDMDWDFDRGEAGNPGFFRINHDTDEENLEEFDLYFTYDDKYGVDIYLENFGFYLNLEWWLINTFPFLYYWLDYEFNMDDFEGYLLWTDLQGNTEWHEIER